MVQLLCQRTAGTNAEAVKPFQPSGMQDASKTIALGCTAHVNVNFFLYGM
jgi:hypothetical protein